MTFESTTVAPKQRAADMLVLCAIAVVSAIPYVSRLGFYTDDWSLIADAVMSPDTSWAGLFAAIESPDKGTRPIFYAAVAGLFSIAGVAPAVMHIANTAILACVPVALYLVLAQFGVARWLAVAIPAVYVLLPHYATARFWFAASSINLSLALFLFSVYMAGRSMRTHGGIRASWRVGWALFLAASLLVYETVLPLVVLVPFVLGHATGMEKARVRWAASIGWLAGTVLVVAPVLVWKLTHSARRHEISMPDRLEWFAEFLAAQTAISVVDFGIRLPVVVVRALGEQRDPMVVLLSVGLGVGLFLYLQVVAARSSDAGRRWSPFLLTMALGAAVWLLALSLFFVTLGPAPGGAGIGNRLVTVAAVGFAAFVVGLIGLIGGIAVPIRHRMSMVCGLIALHGAAGCLVINTLAIYWVDAAREQERVVSAIRQRFPHQIPAGTFIVDGVCPYIGPGIVFESSWDLRARLAVEYGRAPRGADVVTPNMRPTADGLHVSMYYETVQQLYPYANLHVYDIRSGAVSGLVDEVSARAYFARRQAPRCGLGHEGGGVAVLGLRP